MIKMATIQIFDTPIEYDSSIVYGIFSRGQYGRLPVEKTIPKLGNAARDKKDFSTILEVESKGLQKRLDKDIMLSALVDEEVLIVTGLPKSRQEIAAIEKQRREIQNTIDLFAYIRETLGKESSD